MNNAGGIFMRRMMHRRTSAPQMATDPHAATTSKPTCSEYANACTRITLSLVMSTDTQAQFPSLPCFPCPYSASCCAHGTTLTDQEAAAVTADFGPGLVYRTRWGEWRTRIRNRRCVLFRDGGCSIHDKSYYPAVCRGFPWTDAETGGRYLYDVSICGHFDAQPELVQIQLAIPAGDRAGVPATAGR
jgi:hypothetical protein